MTARRTRERPFVRPLAGVLTVLALVLVVVVAVGLFRDSFTKTVPVTVIADRAGLVMYPDAKVKLHGAAVGKVDSIEPPADGGAALHLAIYPDSVDAIKAAAVNASSQAITVSMLVLALVALAGAIFAWVVIGRRRTPDHIEVTHAAQV